MFHGVLRHPQHLRQGIQGTKPQAKASWFQFLAGPLAPHHYRHDYLVICKGFQGGEATRPVPVPHWAPPNTPTTPGPGVAAPGLGPTILWGRILWGFDLPSFTSGFGAMGFGFDLSPLVQGGAV